MLGEAFGGGEEEGQADSGSDECWTCWCKSFLSCLMYDILQSPSLLPLEWMSGVIVHSTQGKPLLWYCLAYLLAGKSSRRWMGNNPCSLPSSPSDHQHSSPPPTLHLVFPFYKLNILFSCCWLSCCHTFSLGDRINVLLCCISLSFCVSLNVVSSPFAGCNAA